MSIRTLREDQAELARERLLDAAVGLVERGEEPTLRLVAAEAGVAERTLYRHFETRDHLITALAPRLASRMGVALCERADQLEDYAKSLFNTFDENAALVRAVLTSPWLAPQFRSSRKANLAAMRALLDEGFPKAPLADRRAAASTLRALLSGTSWLYLRDSCELEQKDVVAHARWSVRVVLERLIRTS